MYRSNTAHSNRYWTMFRFPCGAGRRRRSWVRTAPARARYSGLSRKQSSRNLERYISRRGFPSQSRGKVFRAERGVVPSVNFSRKVFEKKKKKMCLPPESAPKYAPAEEVDLTIREFFEKCFQKKMYDIDPRIDEVLEVVNLKGHEKVHDRIVSSFSGGQQARLLLASALIQNSDLLLLDEPTNNLDREGIAHLTQFLVDYPKTCMVISHDADFLNAFTQGVLYLDVHTHKVEQYVGNY